MNPLEQNTGILNDLYDYPFTEPKAVIQGFSNT